MDINFLKKILGTKSISGDENNVLSIIKNYGKKNKINSFWQDKNVIYHIKGINNKKALIFNGHADTVSPGNLNNWKHPPFGNGKIVVKGNKIFGLGTSDMKGGIFAFIEVAKYFNTVKPPIDLWFSFVIKEEVDGSGTKSFVQWFQKTRLSKYKKIAAIIGEPCSLETIGIGNKGNYFIEIKTFGDSGHGAYPEKIKKHSVMQMFKICQKLKILEKQWQKKYSHYLLGDPTISVLTSINAGDKTSPNKFPDKCSATFDIRTTPKLHNKVLKELRQTLKNFHCQIYPVYEPGSWVYIKKTEEIIKVVKKIVGNIPIFASKGASDQYFFTAVNIPTINFGPGEKAVIHKENEFCYLSRIKKSIDIYKKIVDLYEKDKKGGDHYET